MRSDCVVVLHVRHDDVARRDRLAAFAAGLRTDDIVVVETTHSLIGGDKVDGTAAYGSDQGKDWIDRTRDDRQDQRQGSLCGVELWRL